MHASLSGQSGGAAPSIPGGLEPDSLEDDFTVGRLDEDSGQSTVTQSLSNISALSSGAASKAVPPKELVYALPANTSTRSSLLGQSTGLAAHSRLEANPRMLDWACAMPARLTRMAALTAAAR